MHNNIKKMGSDPNAATTWPGGRVEWDFKPSGNMNYSKEAGFGVRASLAGKAVGTGKFTNEE